MKYKCYGTQTLTLSMELEIEASSKDEARKIFDAESMSLDGWDVDEEHDYNIEINEA
jgi:hypothetical protein